jgi:hypothetical protein
MLEIKDKEKSALQAKSLVDCMRKNDYAFIFNPKNI